MGTQDVKRNLLQLFFLAFLLIPCQAMGAEIDAPSTKPVEDTFVEVFGGLNLAGTMADISYSPPGSNVNPLGGETGPSYSESSLSSAFGGMGGIGLGIYGQNFGVDITNIVSGVNIPQQQTTINSQSVMQPKIDSIEDLILFDFLLRTGPIQTWSVPSFLYGGIGLGLGIIPPSVNWALDAKLGWETRIGKFGVFLEDILPVTAAAFSNANGSVMKGLLISEMIDLGVAYHF